MKRTLIIALLLFGVCSASAQISISGIRDERSYFNMTELAYTENHGWTQNQNGDYFLRADAIYTGMPDRDDNIARMTSVAEFSFFVLDFPVMLTDFAFRYDGKTVMAQADFNDHIITRMEWQVYEVIDANNNGHRDPGEALFWIMQIDARNITDFSGAGLNEYDVAGNNPDPLILGANGVYAIRQTTRSRLDYTIGGGHANIRLTEEHVTPNFDAHVLSFSHAPVPEPGTMVALSIGALALLRRKRRV